MDTGWPSGYLASLGGVPSLGHNDLELSSLEIRRVTQGSGGEDETLEPDAEKLLEMLLDDPEEGRLPGPPRLADPTGEAWPSFLGGSVPT